jgi:hypothetical protein
VDHTETDHASILRFIRTTGTPAQSATPLPTQQPLHVLNDQTGAVATITHNGNGNNGN